MDYSILPTHFLEQMKELLGEEYNTYLDSLKQPSFHGLRSNRLKLSSEELLRLMGRSLRQIPWTSNGFYYEDDFKPARHPYYYAGLYYLQEPSAMAPANFLPIEEGDLVLDLCAAPGGKSTELAAKLRGTGMLLSNDLSNSRAKALLKNLELFGAENVLVSSEAPEKLAEYFDGYFDKILVDAPCSGEGMFRRDEGLIKSYLEKGPDYYSPIQKSILDQAVRMLKPGGMLLYSTCTFDVEEDEGAILHLLKNHADMQLLPLEKKDGFMPGIHLSECVRLFPHKVDGEGHFIALMQKMQNQPKVLAAPGSDRSKNTFHTNLSRQEQEVVLGFLKLIKRTFNPERLYIKNDSVYYLPLPLTKGEGRLLSKIRYLRTGLLLGELKKDRFEPSQALAMCLKKEEFFDTVDLSSQNLLKDDRAVRYLKGETLSLTEQEISDKNGWCLICTDGFPLGFAKRMGASLKNKYYAGWRWQ